VEDVVLNLRGLWCPQPVLRAKKALRTIPIGGVLVLQCTDPMTAVDIPHFVKQTGQRLVNHERQGDLYIYRIIKER
jgi:tRNA 2-thiouridine synthesizing protein A